MKKYWKDQWRVVLVIVASGTLFNASMSLGPILQGRVIDALAGGARGPALYRDISLYLGAVLAIQLARYVKRYSVRVFANRVSVRMRMDVQKNILGRSMEELSGQSAGDLMTRVISDVAATVEGMRKFTTELFDTGVLMLSYFFVLLQRDARMAALGCLFVPAAMLCAEKLKGIIYRYGKLSREKLGRVTEFTYESARYALLFRIFGAEKARAARYDEQLKQLEDATVRANVLEGSMQGVYNAIAMTGAVFIVALGGGKVLEGSWSVGDFSACLSIFAALAVKAGKAARLFNSVQKARVSWARVKPFAGPPAEEKGLAPRAGGAAELIVKELSFRAPGGVEALISGLGFRAGAGQIVGVTGPVASGKSSLLLVLAGLSPYAGSVHLRGRELRELSPAALGAERACAFHDAYLLSDSIRRNVTLSEGGDPSRALSLVCFDEDLRAMPEGLETRVGASGVRLSGGQKQRISLARALYTACPLLILDDPFSAVDAATEEKILNNLKANCPDRLILLISHRIAGFDRTDLVVYLTGEGGALVAPHAELIKRCAAYRELVLAGRGANARED